MSNFDRRLFLSSLAAASVGAGVAPAIDRANAGAPLDADQARPAEDHAWFIARQLQEESAGHAVDFWTQSFCDVRYLDHLPPEIVRGVMGYEDVGHGHSWEADALESVASTLRRRLDETTNPAQCAVRRVETGSLAPFLLSLIGASGRAPRTAFIALDSQSFWDPEAEWAKMLPAFGPCYDRIIGHFLVPKRGFMQWTQCFTNQFDLPPFYVEGDFWKTATQCDATVLTSPALLERDPGLCPRAPTEELAGELVRRFGHALLDPPARAAILSAGRRGSKESTRLLALGSITLTAGEHGPQDLDHALASQRKLVTGSFGPLSAADAPFLIATSISQPWSDCLAGVDHEDRTSSKLLTAPRAPAYNVGDEAARGPGALDLITLWPFKSESTRDWPRQV